MGRDAGGDARDCVVSRISFTLYLNDDFEGGTLDFVTDLRDDGSHGPAHTTMVPKAGQAVLFYQGVPEYAHFPAEIRGSHKSILRADVMYRFQDKETADVGCERVLSQQAGEDKK